MHQLLPHFSKCLVSPTRLSFFPRIATGHELTFSSFFFPETNGRHLEEVDQIFRDSKNIFDPVKQARRLPDHSHGFDEEFVTGKHKDIAEVEQLEADDGDERKGSE